MRDTLSWNNSPTKFSVNKANIQQSSLSHIPTNNQKKHLQWLNNHSWPKIMLDQSLKIQLPTWGPSWSFPWRKSGVKKNIRGKGMSIPPIFWKWLEGGVTWVDTPFSSESQFSFRSSLHLVFSVMRSEKRPNVLTRPAPVDKAQRTRSLQQTCTCLSGHLPWLENPPEYQWEIYRNMLIHSLWIASSS